MPADARVDLMTPKPPANPRFPCRAGKLRPNAARARGFRRQAREQGVTLLEVMVALGIVAIVLVAVYRLQMQSIAMDRIAAFHTQAPLLAQQLVAEVELQAPDFPASDNGDFGEDFPGYTWRLETADVEAFTDPSGRALLKQIDIEIRLNRDEDLFRLRTYRLVNIAS
jgi:general secretion pathway protein I